MPKKKLKIEYKKPEELKPWKENPKQHDMGHLNKSVDKFGVRQPIIIQKGTNRIIAGHGRLKAYMKKGLDKVPVMVWKCTDAEADAYSIADNQLTMSLGWDENIGKLIKEIDEFEEDFTDTLGFDEKELEDMNIFSEDYTRGAEDTESLIEEFEQDKKGEKNEYYFYIEYYNDPESFNELKEKMQMDGQHDINPDWFKELVEEHGSEV